MKEITKEKIEKYFSVTEKAFKEAKKAKNRTKLNNERDDFLDMIERYIKDAHHFYDNGKVVDAFAALNYAHGWLDAGARLGLWDVHDSKLFTVD
ncbi:DUF357 domain-containing protein [Candidatus Woesearchaeota archaeon]|nr:DUF357 domain-containing protein [Candidatus Woesearchaeota archaeon]